MNEQTMAMSPFDTRYPVTQRAGEVAGSMEYTAHILDEVGAPYEFAEIISALDTAQEQDLFIIKLSTPGGRLDSTIMLLDAIDNCAATTVAEVLGDVASAGTIIALACDGLYVAKHAEFMCHYFSGGVGGKGHEIQARAEFMKKNTPKSFKKFYHKFLTAKEIDKLVGGEDYYFNTEEVIERWGKVLAHREKLADIASGEQAAIEEAQVVEFLKSKGYKIKAAK